MNITQTRALPELDIYLSVFNALLETVIIINKKKIMSRQYLLLKFQDYYVEHIIKCSSIK